MVGENKEELAVISEKAEGYAGLPEEEMFIARARDTLTKISRPVQLKLVCLILLIDAIITTLIIFGIVGNDTIPFGILVYFHSILILNTLAIIGLWNFEKWGWYLILFIAVSQIFAQAYLLIVYFQANQMFDKILNILVFLYFIYYFSRYETREIYLS